MADAFDGIELHGARRVAASDNVDVREGDAARIGRLRRLGLEAERAAVNLPEHALCGERDERERAFKRLHLHRRDRERRRFVEAADADFVAVEAIG